MRRIAASLLFLFAFGCNLGPRYEVPSTPVPETWKSVGEMGEAPKVQNWWEVFEDKTLSRLEELALKDNPSLYAAMEKVVVSRAIAGMAKSELYPQVALKPSYNDTGALIELYGVPTNLSPRLKTITRVHEMSYELPLNMNYEVDIWQKYYGTYKAAEIRVQEEQEAYLVSLLTLTSDLASNYFNAKTLDAQIALLRKSERAYADLLRLRQSRYLAGLDSYMDVLEADQNLENLAAEIEDAARQRESFENAIAALIGTAASGFRLADDPLASDPPSVPPGLPSTLLVRRPDIAQAERAMAGIQRLIGVSYATFFPSLDLTGALGFLSPELSKFLTWKGHLWEWGFNIFQTVFDGFLRSSILDAIRAQYEEQVGLYKNAVIVAFQEVEDALNNIEQMAKQSENLRQSADDAERVVDLSEMRFEVGVANRLEVLNNQLSELQAERQWVNVQGLRYQSTVQLIKAIGGSWVGEREQ